MKIFSYVIHTFALQGLSVVGVQQIDRVVEVVEETLKGIQYSPFITL